MFENLSGLIKSVLSLVGQVIKSSYALLSFLVAKLWKFLAGAILFVLGIFLAKKTIQKEE